MSPTWSQVPVAVECQSEVRVEACTFLAAMVHADPVLAAVPRSNAEIVIFVNATAVATDDLVHLRATSTVPGAPAAFEQVCAIDSRAPVDDQRAVLAPCLWRALGPAVAARLPEAVTVTLHLPELEEETRRTTPWGWKAWGGGWGSWSQGYQELSVWTGSAVWHLTDRDRQQLWVGYDRTIERQPSLDVDGEEVVLFADESSVEGAGMVARVLGAHTSIGALVRGGHEDPEGQFLLTAKAHAGFEYDWFPSDDPRGNRLAAAWLVGVQADTYHQPNAIGEERAVFPTQLALLSGVVRQDVVELEIGLTAAAEVLRPDRRYALSAEGDGEVTLGDHVDLQLSMGVTQQAIPGPGEVDASSYEAVTRASYAEPLHMWGNLNLELHWDNTNGAQNNRFEAAEDLDPTGNL
jgi:hypothetical protein